MHLIKYAELDLDKAYQLHGEQISSIDTNSTAY